MPKGNAEATRVQRTEPSTDSRWSNIGINAVAAASICKANSKATRDDKKSSTSAFPFADTDYATD